MCSRLWNRTDKTGDCWLWQGAVSKTNGYGFIHFKGKTISTHRLAWILVNGDIPEKMQVLHKCDVPNCINPDHLFLGTQADNMKDRKEKGRFRGRQVPQAKLFEKDVLAIRQSSQTSVVLGAKYGVYPSTIRDVLHRRTWSHV